MPEQAKTKTRPEAPLDVAACPHGSPLSGSSAAGTAPVARQAVGAPQSGHIEC